MKWIILNYKQIYYLIHSFVWQELAYLDPSGWQEQVCLVGRPVLVEPSSVALGQRRFYLKEVILLTFALLFLKSK